MSTNFNIVSNTTGLPLAGALGGMSALAWEWNGVSFVLRSPPSLNELGAGEYQVSGIDGETSLPTLVLVSTGHEPSYWLIAIYKSDNSNQIIPVLLTNATGSLWSGAAPSLVWSQSPAPSVVTVTNGVYAIVPTPDDIVAGASGTVTSPVSAIPPAYTVATDTPTIRRNSSSEQQSTSFDVLRNFFNPGLKGKNWDILLAALGIGDDYVLSLARAVADQLFLATADGKYLDELALESGNRRPADVGLPDDLFRQLAIELATGRVTYNSICRILEVYYGKEALRAYVDTAPGNFSLTANTDIVFDFGVSSFTYRVRPSQYPNLSNVTPEQLAFALSVAFQEAQLDASAQTVTDADGAVRVRVFSPTIGLRSQIAVVGGTAQPNLHFDSVDPEFYSGAVVSGDGYNWVFGRSGNKTTITVTTLTASNKFDFLKIKPGDYGVFWFGEWGTVESASAIWDGLDYVQTIVLTGSVSYIGTHVQTANDEVLFYRPVKRTNATTSRSVTVAHVEDGKLNITVPATARVYRNVTNAGYMYGNPSVEIASLVRENSTVKVTTTENHGLSNDQLVQISGFRQAPGAGWVEEVGSWTRATLQTPAIDTGLLSEDDALAVKLGTGDILVVNRSDPGPTYIIDNNVQTLVGGNTQAQNSDQNTISTNYVDDIDPSWSTISLGARLTALASPFDKKAILTGIGTPTAQPTTYRFDGTWTQVEDMIHPRDYHAQCLLGNGSVFVTGGNDSTSTATLTSEIYNPFSGLWTNVSDAPACFGSAVVFDGLVLAFGYASYVGATPHSRAAIYNTSTDTWIEVQSTVQAHPNASVVKLSDYECMVLSKSNQPEIFDLRTMEWRMGPPLPPDSWSPQSLCKIGDTIYALSANSRVYWLGPDKLCWNVLNSQNTGTRIISTGAVAYIIGGGNDKNSILFGNSTNYSPIGINGLHRVTVDSPTAFHFETPYDVPATMHGSYDAAWPSYPTSRVSNTVTIQVSVPDDTQYIWVNESTVVTAGLKLLTGKTNSYVTFTEIGANGTGSSRVGTPLATPDETPVAGVPNGHGAFILDSHDLTYVGNLGAISSNITKDSTVSVLTVTDATIFPDEPGHLILNFGYGRSGPIRYLETISATEILLEGWHADKFYPAGTSVIRVLLTPPETISRAYYLADTGAANRGAYSDVKDSISGNVDLNWQIIYPSDIGLGGAGQANTDAPEVWGA